MANQQQNHAAMCLKRDNNRRNDNFTDQMDLSVVVLPLDLDRATWTISFAAVEVLKNSMSEINCLFWVSNLHQNNLQIWFSACGYAVEKILDILTSINGQVLDWNFCFTVSLSTSYVYWRFVYLLCSSFPATLRFRWTMPQSTVDTFELLEQCEQLC